MEEPLKEREGRPEAIFYQRKEREERYNREPEKRLKRICIPTKLKDKKEVNKNATTSL